MSDRAFVFIGIGLLCFALGYLTGGLFVLRRARRSMEEKFREFMRRRVESLQVTCPEDGEIV
jgi:hypothetical protein